MQDHPPAGTPAPRAVVVTVSDRVSGGTREDRSGPRAVERLRAAGFDVDGPHVVPDGAEPVRAALEVALASGPRLVLTTGGTGIGPRDQTPEGTRPLLAIELPGIAEALRREGARTTPTAVLSRGLAGIAGGPPRALVVNLPGSAAAVEEGLDVLLPLVGHVLDQLDGGDHPPPAAGREPALHDRVAAVARLVEREPARRVVLADVGDTPIDAASLAAAVDDPAAGAVVTFSGVVRDHDAGRAVTGIEYVAHPGADAVVAEVAADVAARFPVEALAVVHRVGPLTIGDVALAAAVASAHRSEAFAALGELVEEVKRRLPVWKKQRFADGSHEWVGSA
ncbi:molybdenum cofactor biosynthesis protein MoaE [Georgenia faecalis]|uniref:molybdenum cofactor biosynthesis protein MoaE n=1 Tax=Georgenia faecalis TaxID=2483799 RepID=UPI000FDBEA9A|nr:molybdenum cofactor biosynthesis protein MoaE [Georgenia faecalis]